MTLRKKFSRKFSKSNLKADSTPPPPLPTPSPAKLLKLPAVRPSSPLLDSSSPLIRRGTRRHPHRRSRSFSALTPPTAPFASFAPSRDSAYSQYSTHSTCSVDQPWRSQETWRALHTPPPYPPSPANHPSALPTGSGGWRGKVGEGFFAGRNTPRPRPRRKMLDDEDEGSIDASGRSDGEWDDTRGELLCKLQGLQRDRAATFSTSPRSNSTTRSSPLKTALLPSPAVPDFSHSSSASEESHSVQTPTRSHGGHQRNESFLPPLLPINVQRGPHRTSSFTSLRSSRPAPTPRESHGALPAPSAMPAAIPWGRRSSGDRGSMSPHLALVKPPVPPRSALRPPCMALPQPPPPAQMPVSPDDDELYLPETEDDFDPDASFSPDRERLITPVTPPIGIGRRDTNKSYASGWSSNAGSRTGRSSRQPSWGTIEIKDKHRGGWI